MTNNSGDNEALQRVITAIFVAVISAVIAFTGLWNNPDVGSDFQGHLGKWKWAYVAGVAIFVVGLIVVYWFRRQEGIRSLIIVCIVVPSIIAIVLGIATFPPKWQYILVRGLFILIAAVLPAVMYYLFLEAKRPSLFEEYIANLRRLGLVHPTMDKYDLDAYLQKFEGSFGEIPRRSRNDLLAQIDLETVGKLNPSTQRSDSLGRLVAFEASNLLSPSVLLPLALCTILIGLGWLIILPPLQPIDTSAGVEAAAGAEAAKIEIFNLLKPETTPVGLAFLGAYFFSLQMLFRRYLLNDLRPSAYIAVCQRIVLSVVAVWVLIIVSDPVVAAFAESPPKASDIDSTLGKLYTNTPSTVLVLAFLVGIFPRMIWDFCRAGLKKIKFVERYFQRVTPELPLSLLDGVSLIHESRLEEEDIENVPNMATVDLVQLMLATRFAPNRIIDWVDQAILYTALGPEDGPQSKNTARAKLRAQGIRTASALVAVYEGAKANSDDSNVKLPAEEPTDFEKVLAILGAKGRSPLRTLVDTLKTNPNLRLVQAWQK